VNGFGATYSPLDWSYYIFAVNSLKSASHSGELAKKNQFHESNGIQWIDGLWDPKACWIRHSQQPNPALVNSPVFQNFAGFPLLDLFPKGSFLFDSCSKTHHQVLGRKKGIEKKLNFFSKRKKKKKKGINSNDSSCKGANFFRGLLCTAILLYSKKSFFFQTSLSAQ
jgi:hypothetical protein